MEGERRGGCWVGERWLERGCKLDPTLGRVLSL